MPTGETASSDNSWGATLAVVAAILILNVFIFGVPTGGGGVQGNVQVLAGYAGRSIAVIALAALVVAVIAAINAGRSKPYAKPRRDLAIAMVAFFVLQVAGEWRGAEMGAEPQIAAATPVELASADSAKTHAASTKAVVEQATPIAHEASEKKAAGSTPKPMKSQGKQDIVFDGSGLVEVKKQVPESGEQFFVTCSMTHISGKPVGPVTLYIDLRSQMVGTSPARITEDEITWTTNSDDPAAKWPQKLDRRSGRLEVYMPGIPGMVIAAGQCERDQGRKF